jgi:hypothetical protein
MNPPLAAMAQAKTTGQRVPQRLKGIVNAGHRLTLKI